jgi:hypothetical protein
MGDSNILSIFNVYALIKIVVNAAVTLEMGPEKTIASISESTKLYAVVLVYMYH